MCQHIKPSPAVCEQSPLSPVSALCKGALAEDVGNMQLAVTTRIKAHSIQGVNDARNALISNFLL